MILIMMTKIIILLVVFLTGIIGGRTTTTGREKWPSIAILPSSQYKLFQLFSAGITHILFEDSNVVLNDPKIGRECLAAVSTVVQHLREGSEWAYSVLDASAKSPSGMLDGTLTSFGDYDQCIYLKTQADVFPSFVGKYCSVEFILNLDSDDYRGNITNVMRSRIPAFGFSNIQLGLCLPSLCSEGDIERLLEMKLKGFPLQMTKAGVSCDTEESNSWTTRLFSMSWHQMIALLFVLMCVSAVGIGTQAQMLDTGTKYFFETPLRQYFQPVPQLVDFIMHFSLFRSMMSLLTVDKTESRVDFVEMGTVTLMLGTTFVQSAFFLESSLGLSVLYRLHDLRHLFVSFLYQPFMSEGLYSILPFLIGFSTFGLARSMSHKGLGSILRSIIREYLRLTTLCLGVVCLEFLWPLTAQGPFFTRVSQQLLTKCSNTWWMHLLMMANRVPIEEMCSPHLVYSSLSFQLFLLGVVISFLLLRNKRTGVAVAVFFIALAVGLFLNDAKQLESPVILDVNFSIRNTFQYFKYVHHTLSSQMLPYIMGILAAMSGPKVERSKLDMVLPILLLGCSFYAPLLHNKYGMIARDLYAYFVLGMKVASAAGCFLLSRLWIRLGEGESKKEEEIREDNGEKEPSTPEQEALLLANIKAVLPHDRVVNFQKIFAKLSLSMIMVSMFYIRFDYFTSRLLFSISPYDAMKRLIYTLFYLGYVALRFHLVLVSPFSALRKAYLGD